VSTGADNEFSAGLAAPGGAQPGVLYYQAERAIVAGLRHGWAYLRDNIDQLDNITRYSDEVERAAMRDLFTRDRGQYLDPNKITVGYPFIDSGAPQLCAMVESETGSPHGEFIGDNIGGLMFPGVVTAGGPDRGLQKASLRVRTVAVMMASPHPDVVTYIDAIVDAIISSMRLKARALRADARARRCDALVRGALIAPSLDSSCVPRPTPARRS
jgi:hypothetical protein